MLPSGGGEVLQEGAVSVGAAAENKAEPKPQAAATPLGKASLSAAQ